MKKTKKEEENNIDDLWLFMFLTLLFTEQPKPPKVINIYMGDDE